MPCFASVRRNVPNSHRGRTMPSHARRALGRSGLVNPARRLCSLLGVAGVSTVTIERPVAGARRTVDQRIDARCLAGQVGLEPGVLRFGDDVLQADERRTAHDHGNVRARSLAREHEIAAVRGHGADAHRRDTEGKRVGVSEELRSQASVCPLRPARAERTRIRETPRDCRCARGCPRRRPRRS